MTTRTVAQIIADIRACQSDPYGALVDNDDHAETIRDRREPSDRDLDHLAAQAEAADARWHDRQQEWADRRWVG